MDKDFLQSLVGQGLSQRQIASHLETSHTNVRYWLRRYSLKTCSIRVFETHKCSCGEIDPEKFYGNKKNVSGKCHNQDVIERGRIKKQRAREYLGGCCSHCGFDEHSVALDIHHLDPSQKDLNFRSMRGWGWARIEKELQFCVLLCKNCHAAVHSGDIVLTE